MREGFLLIFVIYIGNYIVSATSPYVITNCNDLIAINNSLSANYNLSNDINCSGIVFPTPIGYKTAFTGSLEGNGFYILGVKLSFSLNNSGLFSYGQGAVIRNLQFLDFSFTSSPNTCNVGFFFGGCKNCFIQNITFNTLLATSNNVTIQGRGGGEKKRKILNFT